MDKHVFFGKTTAEMEEELDVPLGCKDECVHINCIVMKFIDSQILKVQDEMMNNTPLLNELKLDMMRDKDLILLTKAKKGLASLKIMDGLKSYLTYRSAELLIEKIRNEKL